MIRTFPERAVRRCWRMCKSSKRQDIRGVVVWPEIGRCGRVPARQGSSPESHTSRPLELSCTGGRRRQSWRAPMPNSRPPTEVFGVVSGSVAKNTASKSVLLLKKYMAGFTTHGACPTTSAPAGSARTSSGTEKIIASGASRFTTTSHSIRIPTGIRRRSLVSPIAPRVKPRNTSDIQGRRCPRHP